MNMANQDQVIFAITVLTLATLTAFWLMRRAKMRRARNWPTEVGRVESTDVVLKSDGGQSAHYAELKYSYTVQGHTYSGAMRRRFILKGRADKWIAGFADSKALTVKYNPEKAKDSVLLDSDRLRTENISSGLNPTGNAR